MDSQQYYDLFMKVYSQSSNSSANNTPTRLTLFHDLLQGSQSEETNSGTTSDQQGGDCYPSASESVISREENERMPDNGLKTRMLGGEKIFDMIKNKLVSSLSSHGFDAQVKAINRSDYSSCIMKQVKYRSYSLYSRGMAIKWNGNANVKYAWYGASKDELNNILDHGFSLPAIRSGLYGPGVYLSPVDQPLQSFQSAIADENGVKHMLLCRVILGNTEVIRPGSIQHKPSSEEFDSGVDNLIYPNKYIVWNGDMNTHILPEFTVSFKSSHRSCKCEIIRQKAWQTPRAPTSDWMTFASLIRDLTKIVPRDDVELISKYHSEYKKHKITRGELIQLVRNIAGDKLLITIIRSCRNNRSKHTGAAAKLASGNVDDGLATS